MKDALDMTCEITKLINYPVYIHRERETFEHRSRTWHGTLSHQTLSNIILQHWDCENNL